MGYSNQVVVIPAEDVVALEAKECLREWRAKLLELYVVGLCSHDRTRPVLTH